MVDWTSLKEMTNNELTTDHLSTKRMKYQLSFTLYQFHKYGFQ